MKRYLSGLWLIVGLELRQRVRGVTWYVLLGVFFVLVGLVTLLLTGVLGAFTGGTSAYDDSASSSPMGFGGWLFSLIVYFVLMLGTLIVPALSGGAVNGERDAGTLATTQVTLISTGQLVLGKFVAAWISSLAFLGAAVPFIVISVAVGGVGLLTLLVDVIMLAVELGVIAAIGVGLSCVITRPIFSVVTTYLVVAALSLGTLIAFGLLGSVTKTLPPEASPSASCQPLGAQPVPRFDLYWGLLAANPYVVVADASPAQFDSHGNPTDLFTSISFGVRAAQHPPTAYAYGCATYTTTPTTQVRTAQDIYDDSVPSWFVGLTLHLLLAAGALTWGWARTRTPARRLARGSRVA